MRITDSKIGMASYHEHARRHERHERLLTWRGNPPPPGEGSAPRPDQLVLSAEANKLMAEYQAGKAEASAAVDESLRLVLSDQDRLRSLLLERVLGIKMRVTVYVPGQGTNVAWPQPAERRHGWGMEYDLHESSTNRSGCRFPWRA